MSDVSQRIQSRFKGHGLIALVAFLVSVMLWIAVVGGEKIETSKKAKLNYVVPKGLVISNQAPVEIGFRLSGPRAFLKDILEDEIVYNIDLSKADVGEHDVRILRERLDVPLGIDVLSVSPTKIKVSLDKIISKRVPVRPVLSAQLPEDYRVKSVVANPSTVEVRGALVRLNSVSSVPTEVILVSENTLKQKFDANLSIEEDSGVIVSEADQRVSVEINLEGPSSQKLIKAIPITLKVGDENNSTLVDSAARKIRLRPRTVDLFLEGPKQILKDINKKELEMWVQIPELKRGTYRERLIWKLPPELRVIRRSTDSVSIIVP
jgi:YbbR domain-containing protein